VIRKV